MRCDLCQGTGRAVAQRVEKSGVLTDWAVACSCPAGEQWRHKLASLPPTIEEIEHRR